MLPSRRIYACMYACICIYTYSSTSNLIGGARAYLLIVNSLYTNVHIYMCAVCYIYTRSGHSYIHMQASTLYNLIINRRINLSYIAQLRQSLLFKAISIFQIIEILRRLINCMLSLDFPKPIYMLIREGGRMLHIVRSWLSTSVYNQNKHAVSRHLNISLI